MHYQTCLVPTTVAAYHEVIFVHRCQTASLLPRSLPRFLRRPRPQEAHSPNLCNQNANTGAFFQDLHMTARDLLTTTMRILPPRRAGFLVDRRAPNGSAKRRPKRATVVGRRRWGYASQLHLSLMSSWPWRGRKPLRETGCRHPDHCQSRCCARDLPMAPAASNGSHEATIAVSTRHDDPDADQCTISAFH